MQLTLVLRLGGGGGKSPLLGFCVTIKILSQLGGFFLNMNEAQGATIGSSIGAPDVVWRVVKTHTTYFETSKMLSSC